MVSSKETMQEYCKLANRNFREDLWEWCENKVKTIYEHDVDFNSLEEDIRDDKFSQRIQSTYFSQMNQSQYYEITVESNQVLNDRAKEIIEIDDEDIEVVIKSKDKKIHSEKWSGMYTKSQISWLDAYYEDTKNDFNIVSRIHSDYAKKIAKASLNMDESFSDLMNGVASADKRYKEAKAVFDSLSISAKFSEKTRGQNDTAGLGSLAEITAWLEQNGFLQEKIEFEDDDITRINKDLRHVLSSLD